MKFRLVLALAVTASLTACGGEEAVVEEPVTPSAIEPAAKPAEETKVAEAPAAAPAPAPAAKPAAPAPAQYANIELEEIIKDGAPIKGIMTEPPVAPKFPVTFPFDQAIADKMNLNPHINFLKDNASAKVTLHGFTDAIGTVEYNMSLSERRAEYVKKALEAQGVDAARIQTKAHGETSPIVELTDEMNFETKSREEMIQYLAPNRRVEFEYDL